MKLFITFLELNFAVVFAVGIQRREKLMQYWRNRGRFYRGDNIRAVPYEPHIHK